jgi:VanZ family protein
MTWSRRARAGSVIAGVYLLGLVTVLVEPRNVPAFFLRQFWDVATKIGFAYTPGREHTVDGVFNVALFVPVGFLVHFLWRRGSRGSRLTVIGTLVVAAILSACVETIQMFEPFRYASVADVVMNTLGAAIGVGLDTALALRPCRRPICGVRVNPS